jgi:hypothetical protein
LQAAILSLHQEYWLYNLVGIHVSQIHHQAMSSLRDLIALFHRIYKAFHPFGIVSCMISLSRRTKEEIITMKFLRLEGVVKNRDQRISFTRNLILISSLGINKTIPSGLLAFGDANPEGMEDT